MIKEINLNGTIVSYSMQYKNVKNINLRVKPDGTIYISANKGVPQKVIEEFMISKADFILNTLEKCKNRYSKPPKQFFSEKEICSIVLKLCEKIYPYFEKLGVEYPMIKFRRMTSCWGSCRPSKGVLTFNIALMYVPIECIEYVVAHEFTHFLQPNHSDRFYEELAKVMPDWKSRRQMLKETLIR
ncbi:MAG: M48 family metallopeptidase [Clostridia bacterium]|nr:M48 family metallopeptidase [Clostridia bacterium]